MHAALQMRALAAAVSETARPPVTPRGCWNPRVLCSAERERLPWPSGMAPAASTTIARQGASSPSTCEQRAVAGALDAADSRTTTITLPRAKALRCGAKMRPRLSRRRPRIEGTAPASR